MKIYAQASFSLDFHLEDYQIHGSRLSQLAYTVTDAFLPDGKEEPVTNIVQTVQYMFPLPQKALDLGLGFYIISKERDGAYSIGVKQIRFPHFDSSDTIDGQTRLASTAETHRTPHS